MWLWISLGLLVFLIVLEEMINWGWNRYLYGPNLERKQKWKKRMNSITEKSKKIRTKSQSSKP
ncbi:hypothetical protein [Bacillus xiapuensis]|uniref:Uncharacterized protein n=1 Tax=Bacillus xiapuensis TaxID=2014075 RepID=A0ABU6N9S0_9BACI|nr:hypothetical protein [Bacillus xiapuensis]